MDHRRRSSYTHHENEKENHQRHLQRSLRKNLQRVNHGYMPTKGVEQEQQLLKKIGKEQ